MYTIRKTFSFEASHQLPCHDGACRRLHGHRWIGHVFYRSSHLQTRSPQVGMVIDFGRISALLKDLIETRLDHYHLNESTDLPNPTSEELAQYIFSWLQVRHSELKVTDVHLLAVEIEETATSSARYEP